MDRCALNVCTLITFAGGVTAGALAVRDKHALERQDHVATVRGHSDGPADGACAVR